MIDSALIIGGGVGGMTAAIALRRAGVDVELIDADPHWRVHGAGISLTGVSLRAFDCLGVLGAVRKQGFISAGLRVRSVAGDIVKEIPAPDPLTPVQG